METIELAVERLRRPARENGTARASEKPRPVLVAPPPPIFQSQLQIKTRVLCDYSEDVRAIVAAEAPTAAASASVTWVAAVSALAGAALVFAAFVVAGRFGSLAPSPVVATSIEQRPAALTPVPANVAATPAAEVPAAVPTPEAAPPVSATQPARPAFAATPPADQLREFVTAWAGAWSARDVERYLGFYATGFKPDSGMSRSAWENQRRQRLTGSRSIVVGVRDLRIEPESSGRVVVRFAQDYAADAYREAATPKKLLLVREAGGWRIAGEMADPAGKSAD